MRAASGYVFGYPRAVVGVVARELVGLAIESALFAVAPAIAAWYLSTEPWHLAISWYFVGLPLAVVLVAIAVFAGRGAVSQVRERFGLRVVPQFERRLDPEPGTYFSGRHIAARMRGLDALVGDGSLSTFGFVRRDDASDWWFDAARGCATVATLLARVEPGSELHAELSAWLAALRRAEAEGIRFRLAVVTGTTMNGMLWDRLRAAGY
jgi:hypothetical protein